MYYQVGWIKLYCDNLQSQNLTGLTQSQFISCQLNISIVAPHSSTLVWKIHGRRSLVGCSPQGREESDTTERVYVHFLLSCIGEGNGNSLQYSCLENPMDGGAWWAAVHGVARVGHD